MVSLVKAALHALSPGFCLLVRDFAVECNTLSYCSLGVVACGWSPLFVSIHLIFLFSSAGSGIVCLIHGQAPDVPTFHVLFRLVVPHYTLTFLL